MSQFPHDDFVKEYLPELIKDYGIASSGKKITSQTKEIDVLFEPQKPRAIIDDNLGLIGKFLSTVCLIEVYRNSVTLDQINECISKLTDWKTSFRRKLKKNKSLADSGEEIVKLWILTPTLSDKILNLFKAEIREDWEKGIYFLPEASSTGIVVIHQLPVNKETLWLRMLGKGKVQENAIEELKALPRDNPYRDSVLELVSNLFTMLELNRHKKEKLTVEDQELIMKLSPIYKARLEEREQIGLERGIQQGIQQGVKQEATLVIRQLNRKVGELPANLQARIMGLSLNILEDLGEALLDFDSLDDLIDWLNLHD